MSLKFSVFETCPKHEQFLTKLIWFIVNYVLFSSPQKKINRSISSVDSHRFTLKYFWKKKKNQFQTLKAFFL